MVGSENQVVWTVCWESGSCSEIRIGQTLSQADEYYQREHGIASEERQKQNNKRGANAILASLVHERIISQSRVKPLGG